MGAIADAGGASDRPRRRGVRVQEQEQVQYPSGGQPGRAEVAQAARLPRHVHGPSHHRTFPAGVRGKPAFLVAMAWAWGRTCRVPTNEVVLSI